MSEQPDLQSTSPDEAAPSKTAPINTELGDNRSAETPASQSKSGNQVPLKITIGLWLLLAAFLITGLVLTPPGNLTLYSKLLIFSGYTIAIPLSFVVAIMGLNRWFKTDFGRRNAFTLGTMSTLMLVIFLIGQSNY